MTTGPLPSRSASWTFLPPAAVSVKSGAFCPTWSALAGVASARTARAEARAERASVLRIPGLLRVVVCASVLPARTVRGSRSVPPSEASRVLDLRQGLPCFLTHPQVRVLCQPFEPSPSVRRLQLSERHDRMTDDLFVSFAIEQLQQNAGRTWVLHVAQREGQHLSRPSVPGVLNEPHEFLEHRIVSDHGEATRDRRAQPLVRRITGSLELFDEPPRGLGLGPGYRQRADDVLLDVEVRYSWQPVKQRRNGRPVFRAALPQIADRVEVKPNRRQVLQQRRRRLRIALDTLATLAVLLPHPSKVFRVLLKLRHEFSGALRRILRSILSHGTSKRSWLRDSPGPFISLPPSISGIFLPPLSRHREPRCVGMTRRPGTLMDRRRCRICALEASAWT